MLSGMGESKVRHHPSVATVLTRKEDIYRWAVRLGRYTVETLSTVSNGWLRRVRNPL
jgi:hypothetical protein